MGTSCISEQEKYHGNFYNSKKKKQKLDPESEKNLNLESTSILFDQDTWNSVIVDKIKSSSRDSIRIKKLKKRVVKELLGREDIIKKFLESEFDKQIKENSKVKKVGSEKVKLSK